LFEGWFTTATFADGTLITEIPAGSAGDVEVWAKWTQLGADEDEGLGIVKGNISIDGVGQEGVAVTLRSNPRTTFTDADGNFRFENVEFTDHTLVITNSAGAQISEYTLDFTQGDSTRVVIDGELADITYENNAVTVQLDITMNADGTGTTLDEITIISNPDTYGETGGSSWLLWVSVALIVLVALLGLLVVIAYRKTHREQEI